MACLYPARGRAELAGSRPASVGGLYTSANMRLSSRIPEQGSKGRASTARLLKAPASGKAAGGGEIQEELAAFYLGIGLTQEAQPDGEGVSPVRLRT